MTKNEDGTHFFSSKTKEEIKEKYPLIDPNKADTDAQEIEHEEYLKKIQEDDAVLVCITYPLLGFDDNIAGVCGECGATIYYRPYNKKATKKICIDCAKKKEGFQ